MKKFITSVSLAGYLLVSCGFVLNTHYCMNQLSSVHLFENESRICNKCGMSTHESDGCCRDEVKVVKLVQDQHKIPVITFNIENFQLPVTYISDFLQLPDCNSDVAQVQINHSPPILLSAQHTYLLNNVFRI